MALNFSKATCALFAAAVMAVAGTQSAQAIDIPVPNGSFEEPSANNEIFAPFYASPGNGSWVHATMPVTWPYPNAGQTAWDSTAGVFYDFYDFVDNRHLDQVAFFFSAKGNELTQLIGTNYDSNLTYTLSFMARGGGQGMPLGTQLKVWLYYVDAGNKVEIGSTTIANDFNNTLVENPPGSGNFQYLPISHLNSYSFNTAIPLAANGKEIGIAITSLNAVDYLTNQSLDFGYWDLDNVTLAVPEPASLGVLAVGAMGLCLRRRKARA
jgi:hypothetical protein